MKFKQYSVLAALALAAAGFFTGCTPVNSNYDAHFDEDGYLLTKPEFTFEMENPTRIKFYVEVSGSMNGFFRANKPTRFKRDVWEICSFYSEITQGVTVLTNDGSNGATVPLSQFQNQMNTGAFVSTASTQVPVMLQTIINNLEADKGEVAVLISDMKYDPVGQKGAAVLPSQYSSDISRILGRYGKSVCLVGAVSDYLGRNGNVITPRSPYYFFIIGKSSAVASVRDGISALLQANDNFVENIESGFIYGAPKYAFGIPNMCFQEENESACPFRGYEETDGIDTCTVKLKVDLSPYRWLLTSKEYFEEAFSVKAKYGSNVKVGNVEINVLPITNKELKRTAFAVVDLKVFNMATDSEVLEWSLTLPDTDYTNFGEFCGSNDPNDPNKTYSLENFIKGIFYGGVVNQSLDPNHILISKI